MCAEYGSAKPGSRMYRAMEALCADYVQRAGGEEGQASILGEDEERKQLAELSDEQADGPRPAATSRVLRARSQGAPVAIPPAPPVPRSHHKGSARPKRSKSAASTEPRL